MDQEASAVGDDSLPLSPRLTMRRVMSDAIEHFFNLESGWMRTVRDLTVAPGQAIRRYVEGRRKVYANPFAYLVLATAVSIIAQKLFGFHERLVDNAGSGAMSSPLQAEFVTSFSELVFQNSLYISFGVLVPMALLTRFFFRRSGYNLAECFVFALYSVGHTALLSSALVPLIMALPASPVIQGGAPLVFAIAYVVFAANGFFDDRPILVGIKTGVAYVIAYALFMVVMMALVIVYVLKVMVPASAGVPWDLVTATEYEVPAVVEQLLKDGSDVNATKQRTALHEAAALGNLEIIELLIEHGADVNLQDVNGRIPLFVALANHQPEAARRLMQEETDTSLRAIDGSTLLIAAVRAEQIEAVRWALDRGVDVNAERPGKKNATALMRAAALGNTEIVSLLIDGGADPTAANHEGQTALDLAKGAGVKELLGKHRN